MDVDSTPSSTQVSAPTSGIHMTQSTPPPEPPGGAAPTEVKRQLQVIDEYQTFSPRLHYYMNEVWRLGDVGFNYNLVAVFGSQHAAQCALRDRFDTMGEFSRQQTTRGLWLGLAKGANTLIMDVEGVDGREHGEDQDFERKSALFSLAVAQVVLVNLWENQVGLYNGANIGLLRTVFEVNLELFQQKGKGKTLLLFVIRDYLGKVPLSQLSQTLKQDLQKPKGLEGCVITDFFDFMFFGLPHRVLLPEDFDEQVQMLAQCFYDPSHPNYVFRPQYHKRIPADGLQHYAESIWEQIMTDKNLDLPTQQQLLAQFRCDEIAAALFDSMVQAFQPYREAIEVGDLVPDLGKVFRDLKEGALASFDGQAGRYHPDVYQKKRAGLVNKIEDYLHAYFKAQLSVLAKDALAHFAAHLKVGMSHPDYDFAILTGQAVDKAKRSFAESAAAMSLLGSSWSYAKEERELDRELAAQVASRRRSELAKLEGKLALAALDRFEEDLPALLSLPRPGMWEGVLRSFAAAGDESSKVMQARAEAFELSPEEVRSRVADVRVRAWEVLVVKVKEEVASEAMLLAKLRQSLEEKFRYDSEGLPRVWLPEDDIDTHFKLGKAEARNLLPLLSRIDVTSDPVGFSTYFDHANRNLDFKKSLVLVTPTRQAELEARFKRESDALYLEAKRWNEILYIISSPLMFITVVFLGMGLYIVHTLRLGGPLLQFLNIVGNELYQQVFHAMDSEPRAQAILPSAPKSRTPIPVTTEPIPQETSGELTDLGSQSVSSESQGSGEDFPPICCLLLQCGAAVIHLPINLVFTVPSSMECLATP
ncbi:Dynamin-like GTPase that mediates homotypic ER fusion [Massospora cicadina]|nr:Dynamin-like GTPase that mediates homotypic ER fusion [Massospora cicadina]